MDWGLVVVLVLACLPGVLWVVPRALDTMLQAATDRLDPDATLPSRRVLVALAVGQSTVLVGIAAAIGAFTAPAVGFEAPAFAAVFGPGAVWPALEPQLLPAVAVSLAGSAVFLLAYYGVFRPRLDERSVRVMERLRLDLGILGRVLYGGVAEEILARWGLVSLLAWLGSLAVGGVGPAVIWAAILVAGVLFGLGHLPSYLGAGCRATPTFLAAMLFLNGWASVIFGWLFWQYGLEAAILSHALFHLAWLPFDYAVADRSAT